MVSGAPYRRHLDKADGARRSLLPGKVGGAQRSRRLGKVGGAPQPPGQGGWQPTQYSGGMPPGGLPHGMGWGAPQFAGPGGPGSGGPGGFGGPGRVPPRKKGGAGKVLLIVGGLVLLAVVGMVALSASLKDKERSYTSPYPTSSYSPTGGPSEKPSAEPPTASPSRPVVPPRTKPTATRPTAPRSTYKPTKKPKPEATDIDIVARNRLYKAGVMASVNCRESSARPATVAGARANYANLAKCLNRSWPALIAKGGSRFRPPTVLSFSGYVSTPCGTKSDDGPPFYCTINETIYMNLREDIGNYNANAQNYSRVFARMWMLHQFAHEYGHHVQQMTGIFRAYANLRYEAPTQALELQYSRRLELQASCFSDIFIASNKRSYPITGESLRQWKWLIGNTIDPKRDHGNRANHKYWALKGFNGRGPAACNTFAVSPPRVS